mgnify:CR=1 FL=1
MIRKLFRLLRGLIILVGWTYVFIYLTNLLFVVIWNFDFPYRIEHHVCRERVAHSREWEIQHDRSVVFRACSLEAQNVEVSRYFIRERGRFVNRHRQFVAEI